MAQISIDRRSNDPFGRYGMPRLLVQIEKGSKTVLMNLNAVAKSLDRSPTDLSKFLRCQLSTQVINRSKENRYIFSGVHHPDDLQNIIYDYIDRFVLCSMCRNPETILDGELRMGAHLDQCCKVCGHCCTLHVISPKLTVTRSSSSADRNQETSKDDSSDEDDLHQNKPVASATKYDVKTDGTKQLSELLKMRIHELHPCDLSTANEITCQVERMDIKEKAPFIAALALFTDNIVTELDDYKILFNKLCTSNAKGQLSLLNALQSLCIEQKEIRDKIFNKRNMTKVLLKLYDHDIVDEENFYLWYDTTSEDLQEISRDFIQWLRTAEEYSDNE